jgi:hypothetical protein
MGKLWLYFKRALVYNILIAFVGVIAVIFLTLIGMILKVNVMSEKGEINIVFTILIAPVLLVIGGFMMTKIVESVK